MTGALDANAVGLDGGAAHGMSLPEDRLWAEAIEWQATRGARSGRVAWQFFCDLAARMGVRVA